LALPGHRLPPSRFALRRDRLSTSKAYWISRWGTAFPNAASTVALIDRLTHHVEIVTIEGDS